MNSGHFSYKAGVFHGRQAPEEGFIAGYAAVIESLSLPVPIPHKITLTGNKSRRYETEDWLVFPQVYKPENNLYKQLVFAIKYEGINLLFFKNLFQNLQEQEVLELLKIEPTGQYSRRIWFLYEWLMDTRLNLPDLGMKNSVTLLDEKLQYAVSGVNSPRHRIINNLPGTKGFCPLIFKTSKLEAYSKSYLSAKKTNYFKNLHSDVLQRASAFLLLKDSKASFSIEGESPGNNRAMRWGKAIGQAGF